MPYVRILDLKKALSKKSHFLLGPRSTGKSYLIRQQLADAQVFDLLNSSTYARLLRNPGALAEEITKKTVVIDEVQKLPALLDEVHRLIEERHIRFLLTGSSARKLKHGGANLLGGRARLISMFPLVTEEIKNFELGRYCNFGGLPSIYDAEEPWLELRDYVHLYLKEEIVAEAVVRKIDHYARFLDVMGQASGQ
jgi:predicted AAA+ superfamily ATPase